MSWFFFGATCVLGDVNVALSLLFGAGLLVTDSLDSKPTSTVYQLCEVGGFPTSLSFGLFICEMGGNNKKFELSV